MDEREQRPRIALFGGTFDPVHLGHLHMAALAREQETLDEVRFLPCRISPHKDRQPTSGAHRLEMLRQATEDLPWATIDDFELSGPEPSYSYVTAETMAARQPGVDWFWLMGGDQWEALPRWKHPERLAAVVTFLVLARGGDSPGPRLGYRMRVVSGDHPASSTLIRSGKMRDEWLPPAVRRYVSGHALYQF